MKRGAGTSWAAKTRLREALAEREGYIYIEREREKESERECGNRREAHRHG